jgi:hypothetical protein
MKLVRKHARFGAVMIVLVVVLWLANDALSGFADDLEKKQGAAKTSLTQNYGALFRDAAKFDGDPATVQGRKIQDKSLETNAYTDMHTERMVFETDPAYTVDSLPSKARDEMVNYLRNVKKVQLQRELGYARYFGPNVADPDAFGFTIPTDDKLTEADVRDYLRKLDITRSVCYSVDRTGVQTLVELKYVSVDETVRQRGVPSAPAAPGEPPFFSGQGLEIRVLATEAALYNFLVDLQNPEKDGMRNRYLSVESFVFDKPDLLDPKDQLITARITVIAWRVNPESSYPPEESSRNTQQTAGGKPRTFR